MGGQTADVAGWLMACPQFSPPRFEDTDPTCARCGHVAHDHEPALTLVELFVRPEPCTDSVLEQLLARRAS